MDFFLGLASKYDTLALTSPLIRITGRHEPSVPHPCFFFIFCFLMKSHFHAPVAWTGILLFMLPK
jgi:hypothetical protein